MNSPLRSLLHALPYAVALVAVGVLTGIASANDWRINVEGFNERGGTPTAILLAGLACIWFVSAWLKERGNYQWPKNRRRAGKR
jgi:hypothetical protein